MTVYGIYICVNRLCMCVNACKTIRLKINKLKVHEIDEFPFMKQQNAVKKNSSYSYLLQ